MNYLILFITAMLLFSCKNTEIKEKYADGNKKIVIIYDNKEKGDFKIIEFADSGDTLWKGVVRNQYYIGNLYFFKKRKIVRIDSLLKPCKYGSNNCDCIAKKIDKNGVVRSRNSIIGGVENGLIKKYDSLGRLQLESRKLNGKENGVRYQYYDNGILAFKATIINDTIQGDGIFFYGN